MLTTLHLLRPEVCTSYYVMDLSVFCDSRSPMHDHARYEGKIVRTCRQSSAQREMIRGYRLLGDIEIFLPLHNLPRPLAQPNLAPEGKIHCKCNDHHDIPLLDCCLTSVFRLFPWADAWTRQGELGVRPGNVGVGWQGAHDQARDTEEESEEDDMDYLLDDQDDPELRRLEQVRLVTMQEQSVRAAMLRTLGYGVHREVSPLQVEKELGGGLEGGGLVCHFYHPHFLLGPELDLYLENFSSKYLGTRFIRCFVQPDSESARRIHVQQVPALACYKGGMRMAYTEEMGQFGHGKVLEPLAVNRWLEESGVLQTTACDDLDILLGKEEGISNDRGESRDGSESRDGVGADQWTGRGTREAYDCGLEGCCKPYAHDHFLSSGEGSLPGEFHFRGLDRP
ncbi:unnamed protein product [Choristocarpus tenellus]